MHNAYIGEIAIKKISMRAYLHYRAGRYNILNQVSANYGPWKQSGLLLIFINKVYLAHYYMLIYLHLFYSSFYHCSDRVIVTELLLASKPKICMYYLNLYRKKFYLCLKHLFLNSYCLIFGNNIKYKLYLEVGYLIKI